MSRHCCPFLAHLYWIKKELTRNVTEVFLLYPANRNARIPEITLNSIFPITKLSIIWEVWSLSWQEPLCPVSLSRCLIPWLVLGEGNNKAKD